MHSRPDHAQPESPNHCGLFLSDLAQEFTWAKEPLRQHETGGAAKPGRDQSVHVRLVHVEFNVPEQLRIAFSFSSSEHPPFVRDEDVRNEADDLATEARVNYVNVLPKWTDAAESV